MMKAITMQMLMWIAAILGVSFARADDTAPLAKAHAARARSILDAWHADASEPGDRRLHVICWRTKDRDFAADHRGRLDRILTDIQGFYRKEMERHGLGSRTIRLDRDADGRLVVHEVVGAGRFTDYEGHDGARIRDECRSVLREKGIDIDRETIMIFTNLAEWDPVTLTFRHKSPYYASGNHLGGTAWQLDSPELDTVNLPLTLPLIQDGQYGRISLGRHNSIFIGGIAHELGHALGLPHCHERNDEATRGTALMGSGNSTYGEDRRGEGKGTCLTFADALRLASHPQFSGSVKGLRLDEGPAFEDLSAEVAAGGRSFTVRGRVGGTPPVYAVVAYLDPAGNRDYDSRTVTAVPDTDGRFEVNCTPLVPGKAGSVRLVACRANGATSGVAYPYSVAENGEVEIEAMEVSLALVPFCDAIARQDFSAAERLLERLPAEGRSRRIASSILGGAKRYQALVPAAPVADAADSVPLSQIEPVEARVAWLRPAFDHLPRRDSVIAVAGTLFETGIYAHAPAVHRYRLDGRWRRLTGSCGLPEGGGSVVFVIRVDDREAYRSPRMEPGQIARYDVDLTGAGALELRTEDGGDGKAADWAVWLTPLLSARP